MLVAILYGDFKKGNRPDTADSLVQADLVGRVLAERGWETRRIPSAGIWPGTVA